MSDFPRNQHVKLNSFGETVRRIEAERLAEAESRVAAGWAEADHPAKCCPHLVTAPQPKRAVRPLEELERLRARAANKAKWWSDAANRAQAELGHIDAVKPKFDHGFLNLPVGPRAREADRSQRIWRDLEYRKERAKHFAHLAKKYATQIEKRKP